MACLPRNDKRPIGRGLRAPPVLGRRLKRRTRRKRCPAAAVPEVIETSGPPSSIKGEAAFLLVFYLT